jgi:hypothetical protein
MEYWNDGVMEKWNNGKMENWNDGIVGSRRKWINWKYPPINPIPPISPIYPIPYTQYFFPLMIR